MRHNTSGKILDRKKGPREALIRGLASNLVLFEKMRTTKAKAQAVRPVVERMVTLGKRGNLDARRRLNAFFYGDNIARKIIEVLAPRYKDRKGGYLRVTKLMRREGDGAEMVQIEFV